MNIENKMLKNKLKEISSNGESKVDEEQVDEETNRLKASILEAQELNKTLEANYSEWLNANQVVEKAILDAQELNSTLAERLSQWNASNDELREAADRRAAERHDKQTWTECDERYEAVLKQVETYKAMVDAQKSLLDKQDREITEMGDKFDVMLVMKEQLIERLEARIATLECQQGDGGEWPSRYASLEADYNTLDTAKMQLECDLIAARNEIDRQSQEAQRTQAAVDQDQVKQIGDLNTKVAHLEQSNLDLQTQLSAIKSDMDAAKQSACLYQTQNEDLARQIRELESNLKCSTEYEKLKHLQLDLDNVVADVRRVESAILENQDLNKQLNENLIEWQQANQVIEEQVLKLQERNANLADSLDEITSSHELELIKKITSLENLIREKDGQINELAVKLNEVILQMKRILFVEILLFFIFRDSQNWKKLKHLRQLLKKEASWKRTRKSWKK